MQCILTKNPAQRYIQEHEVLRNILTTDFHISMKMSIGESDHITKKRLVEKLDHKEFSYLCLRDMSIGSKKSEGQSNINTLEIACISLLRNLTIRKPYLRFGQTGREA